jgi:septum formation protein
MRRIILASSSPRRKELLEQIHLEFEIEASDYPENRDLKLAPVTLVRFLSREKARAVAPKYPNSIVIAADTIGVIDGHIIGKPESVADAGRMLRQLSGKTHIVITGFTVLDTSNGRELTRTVKTEVTFRKLTKTEIEAYLATGEGLDKAGAYAVQGRGAVFVKEIRGDYYNVVGLPLSALAQALKKFGVDVQKEKYQFVVARTSFPPPNSREGRRSNLDATIKKSV